MPVAEKSKMVNGRVEERTVAKASRVLEDKGLTMSAFIRNSLHYVAETGIVPESGFPQAPSGLDKQELRSLIRNVESAPMPGKRDYLGLNEDELVERLLMERHGYR